nr:hypothetical protein HmN_000274700 [Hymenolepis microstoma]
MQWTAALYNVADWPRFEAVAEFRPRTGRDWLAIHLHKMGVYVQPTCPLGDLQGEMKKTHLIPCPALQTMTETQRYWGAGSQLVS